jgi:hypothetical protein
MHVSEHRCLSYTQTRQGLKGKARSRESGAIRDEDLYRKARPWRPRTKKKLGENGYQNQPTFVNLKQD